MPKSKTTATYFKCLKLEHVRSFGSEQPLDLTDESGTLARWTLLLGDNGVGKTTLLQCLGWMRPGYEGSQSSKKIGIGPALPGEDNDVIEGLLRVGKKTDFDISAEICQGSELGKPPRKTFSTTIKALFNGRKLKTVVPSWISEASFKKRFGKFNEPFIIAYGANRQMGEQNLGKNELEDTITNRLSGVTELYDVIQILTELDYAARAKNSKGKEQRLLNTFKYSLTKILPGDMAADAIRIKPGKFIEGEFKRSTVNVKMFSGLVPIQALSIGYQTMLAWVLDFAWRLSHQYPDSNNPLQEPAIVLIDEIDLHLHPHWQLKVMDTLAEIFTRTQFIASAHSPLMVQSKPTANFAVVRQEGTEAVIENEPGTVRGWRVDQILNSDYFSIYTSRDPETQKLYERRDQLTNKPKRSLAEERQLREVEGKILALPVATNPDDIEAMELIREAAQLLKSEKNKR
jgi:energy-coupling factor transporter ATP-binding protein EcfA2